MNKKGGATIDEEVISLYLNENLSQRDIAKKLGVVRSTVRCCLDRNKIKKSKAMILKSMKGSLFVKGNKINLGRERVDMLGNTLWDNPNNPFKKGHKLNITTGISLYRRKVNRDSCSQCGKKKKYGPKQINMDVHHIDKNRKNNLIENLLSVCRSCHILIHMGGIKID